MAEEQGLYGECKRFEVALGTKTFEDLVESRKDFYKKVKQSLSNAKEVDRCYGICISGKREINSGNNWSTNKYISISVNELIEIGEAHKSLIARLSEAYKLQWDEFDMLIKKYLQSYRGLIEDTLRNTIEAEIIHKDLQTLRKSLQRSQQDIKEITLEFIKKMDKLNLDFCSHVEQLWSKMKKKEPKLFSTKDSHLWISEWVETIRSMNINSDSKFITDEVDAALDDLGKTKGYFHALFSDKEYTG